MGEFFGSFLRVSGAILGTYVGGLAVMKLHDHLQKQRLEAEIARRRYS